MAGGGADLGFEVGLGIAEDRIAVRRGAHLVLQQRLLVRERAVVLVVLLRRPRPPGVARAAAACPVRCAARAGPLARRRSAQGAVRRLS
eukprot:SAG11_NODE_917_length_6553_cov_24.570654_1_plen_88_part_10